MTTATLSLPQATSSFEGFETTLKAPIFTLASYLTDPACKFHELCRRIEIVDTLNPTAHKITNLFRKGVLFLGVFFCAPFTPLSLLGIGLRFLAANTERKPFIHWKGNTPALQAKPKSLSLLSWNICCVGAGYAISDGGVVPWPFRIDALLKKIMEQKADVVCLSEIFDIKTARQLYGAMKGEYAHFYFNIGPRSVGISSGLFVASKYEIKNPTFTPFPKEMLVGRTKNAEKGIFAFDLANFATIFTTHLQHSEEPAFPTSDEPKARRQEMELLIQKVEQVKNRAIIVTGDLNMDDLELNALPGTAAFDKGVIQDPEKSWGGDEFCAKLTTGKKVSGPLNLDHTMIKKGTAQKIETSLVRTGYEAKRITKQALSDHHGLISHVTLL